VLAARLRTVPGTLALGFLELGFGGLGLEGRRHGWTILGLCAGIVDTGVLVALAERGVVLR